MMVINITAPINGRNPVSVPFVIAHPPIREAGKRSENLNTAKGVRYSRRLKSVNRQKRSKTEYQVQNKYGEKQHTAGS